MASFATERSIRDHDRRVVLLNSDHSYNDGSDHNFLDLNLRPVIVAVRSNLRIILAIVALSLVAAIIFTLLATPRYTASSSIQIDEQADSVLYGDEETGDTAGGPRDEDRFLQTQLDVLNSRSVAERVARSLKLQGNAEFFDAMETGLPSRGTPVALVNDVTVGLLQDNMEAELPPNSRIVNVAFTSADPDMSARITDAFVKEFMAANLQRKFDSSAYARDFVSQQLAEAKTKLESSEIELNDYARETGLINTQDALTPDESGSSAGGSVTTASLVQLNQAANEARAKRIEAEGRWKAISSGSPLNSVEALGNQSVQALLTRRADTQSKLQQELARHLDDHPTVVQLKAEAAEIQRQLDGLIASVRASVKADYDAALAAEQQLEGQVSALKSDTLSEQGRAVQYKLLAREVNTNRTLYDGLLQRFNELNAIAGVSTSNISVIDRADVPLEPSSPNLMLNLLIALVGGLGLAGLVVLFRYQFDDSIREPEDIERKLGLPLLSVIPKSKGEPEEDLADPKSALSEAYSSLGSSLLYSTSEGLPRILLMTSAQPSEGKSTTSHAIAKGFARIGKRVVLIDMDMRRPSLHRVLGIGNKQGMSTLLTANIPVESVLQDSTQPGLKLITSGPVPPNPTDLIASPRMKAALDELANKFDVVLIDSPPVLGLADAPLLSALAGGVVMIVETGRGHRGTLKASIRRLLSMKPVLLGAVLTKFDTSKASSRYSDYYGWDYYQYGSDQDVSPAGRPG